MGDQSGQIISTRAKVDLATNVHKWLWYLLYVVENGICYMLNVCVLSRYLPVVEMMIPLCGRDDDYPVW